MRADNGFHSGRCSQGLEPYLVLNASSPSAATKPDSVYLDG